MAMKLLKKDEWKKIRNNFFFLFFWLILAWSLDATWVPQNHVSGGKIDMSNSFKKINRLLQKNSYLSFESLCTVCTYNIYIHFVREDGQATDFREDYGKLYFFFFQIIILEKNPNKLTVLNSIHKQYIQTLHC